MPNLLFRCDAGIAPEIGTGHIFRCLNLANQLINKKIYKKEEILFLTRNDPVHLFGKIILKKNKFNFQTINIKNNNSIEESRHILKCQPSLVIMDRLKTNKNFIQRINSQCKVVTFDDYGSGRGYCDLAVSAIFSDVEKNKNVLKGYKYLILNIKNKSTIKITNKIKNIFISFGGYDKRNFLSFFLKNIDLFPKNVKFKIIVSDFLYKKIIKKLKVEFNEDFINRLSFFKSPKDYSKIFSKCDISICSGGLTLFESCALGIPTIALPQNMHQYTSIKKLSEKKCVILGSNYLKKDMNFFRSLLKKLVHDHTMRKVMSSRSKKLIDINGITRVVNAIKKLK